MIFRNPDYTPSEQNSKFETLIKDVKAFAKRIAPENKREAIDYIEQNLSVIICDKDRTHKCFFNGKLRDQKLREIAHCFWTDVNIQEMSGNQGIALFEGANGEIVAHESLHTFSSEIGKLPEGGFFKNGTDYVELNTVKGKWGTYIGTDLNESVTDALASRFCGKIGPTSRAGYASQVLMADLLIGEKIENNFFVQNAYFGKIENFAEDFDTTIKTSKVKFSDYMDGFSVFGTKEDNQKSDNLLQAAIEYNLRKAKTEKDINQIYDFQKKVINYYKDGGIKTNFMEDDDFARMENLLTFADKMQKQSKSNLLAQKMLSLQTTRKEI